MERQQGILWAFGPAWLACPAVQAATAGQFTLQNAGCSPKWIKRFTETIAKKISSRCGHHRCVKTLASLNI